MRKIYLLIIFVFASKTTYSQLAESVNKIVNVTNSLTYNKEIRIYEFAAISNYSELFRIYQLSEKNWKIEYFRCYRAANKTEINKYEKIPINVKIDFNLLWLKIVNSDIINLADWDQIKYKLKKNGEIIIERGSYELILEKVDIMDGKSVTVMIRDEEKQNTITYSNPEQYFKHYPKVDELQSFINLLDLLKEEFVHYK